MPQVSLTTFVDFVVASGTTRLTRVRRAKSQYEDTYGPEKDFYGPARKRITAVFESGWDPTQFDALLAEVNDPKKMESYTKVRNGLRKWAGVSGKRQYGWHTPKKAVWKAGALQVNVSPELWIDIDGVPHVIKLYFKGEKLSQQKVGLVGRNHGFLPISDHKNSPPRVSA